MVDNWTEANQRYLIAALAPVKYMLERHLAHLQAASITEDEEQEQETRWQAMQQALTAATKAMPAPANLLRLCETFQLSPFERDVLLLCSGMELEGPFATLCTAIQHHTSQASDKNVSTVSPTFSLALAAFPHAHWDALTPAAPLRCWHLLETGNGTMLTLSPLHIDEYILHYLVGATYTDTHLAHLLNEVAPANVDQLVPTQRTLAEKIVTLWQGGRGEPAYRHDQSTYGRDQSVPTGYGASRHINNGEQPVIQLCGEDVTGKQAIVAAACDALGLQLRLMHVTMLPTMPTELASIIRLWEREALLNNEALVLDCTAFAATDSVRASALRQVLQQVHTPLIVTSRERFALPALTRPMLTLDVAKPNSSEQRSLWRNNLKPFELNGQVDQLVAQFHLSASAIHNMTDTVLASLPDTYTHANHTHGTHEGCHYIYEGEPAPEAHDIHVVTPLVGAMPTSDTLATSLWDACRAQARPQLDELAQRIDPQADWHTLVLPEVQLRMLHEIVAQVRQRTKVYENWNFRPGGLRGLGIGALFAGPSGTGKTLAAEVMAHALRLDLYRIDLSSVVSKYIGETEKNLRRVFDAAEEGGVVLLFDEADALFGKRSEVKDSHDRYANIEVSYLLQRMEEYRGLAILTTNFKNALDVAFMRRLRFVVQFPFPDVTQRAEIWRRIFPASLPTENLDMQKLARLNVAGGNIRNIALNAAFLAADANEPVRMKHLLRAAGTEYAKIEKPLTTAEIGGWE